MRNEKMYGGGGVVKKGKWKFLKGNVYQKSLIHIINV